MASSEDFRPFADWCLQRDENSELIHVIGACFVADYFDGEARSDRLGAWEGYMRYTPTAPESRRGRLRGVLVDINNMSRVDVRLIFPVGASSGLEFHDLPPNLSGAFSEQALANVVEGSVDDIFGDPVTRMILGPSPFFPSGARQTYKLHLWKTVSFDSSF